MLSQTHADKHNETTYKTNKQNKTKTTITEKQQAKRIRKIPINLFSRQVLKSNILAYLGTNDGSCFLSDFHAAKGQNPEDQINTDATLTGNLSMAENAKNCWHSCRQTVGISVGGAPEKEKK